MLFLVKPQEYPNYTAYKTPPLFSDDWLNIYLDHYQMHEDRENFQKYDQISCSDYRFVYMGGKGKSKNQTNCWCFECFVLKALISS